VPFFSKLSTIFFLIFLNIFVLSGCGGGATNTNTGTDTNDTIIDQIDDAPQDDKDNKTIEDTTKPEIYLTGSEYIYLKLGENYHELGAVATDDIDGNISASISIDDNIDLTSTGVYTVSYTAIDAANNAVTINRYVIVTSPTAQSFADIQNLIQQSKDGYISNLTYISIGDSTRADTTTHQAQYLFEEMQKTLSNYNVDCELFARSALEAKHFADLYVEGVYEEYEAFKNYTWKNLVDNYIQNDGSTTILDISLGVNDGWTGNLGELKSYLTSAINHIRVEKPKTHFILTMPARLLEESGTTNTLRSTYIALSEELNIPMNNVVDSLMPTRESTNESWYKDNVHLSESGNIVLANFILSNILP
jgi:hypothetical protein